jgi:hypothetical protein
MLRHVGIASGGTRGDAAWADISPVGAEKWGC